MAFNNTYTLNVDLKQSMTSVVPTFKQGESGFLRFRLFDNGHDLDVSTYTSSEILHKLPSGTTVLGNLDLINVNGEQLLEYRYTGLEMAEVGKVQVQLVIQSANTNVAIRPFKVIIYEDISNDEITYVGILQELIAEVSLLKEELYKSINSWRFIGVYNSNTQYYKHNVVTDGGSSWIALRDNINSNPPLLPLISNLDWHILAQKGDGKVNSVNGVVPDSMGNVNLIPSNIGASSTVELTNVRNQLENHITETSKYTVITANEIQTIIPNQEVDIRWVNLYNVNNSDFARLENNNIILKKGVYIYFCYMGLSGNNSGVRRLRINNLSTTFNNNDNENVILMSSLILDIPNNDFILPTKIFQNSNASLNTVPTNNLIRILKVSD